MVGYNQASLQFGNHLVSINPATFITLSTPYALPVTIQRNAYEYRILETAADMLATYTGATVDLADGGDLDAAIIAANAGDIIRLADDGIYDMPTNPIDKKIAIISAGRSHVGTFNNMSGSTITTTGGGLYNATKDLASSYRGFVRRDGTKIQGLAGSAFTDDNDVCIDYKTDGIQATYTAGGSTNFSMGNSDNLATEIGNGNILAWTLNDTDAITLNAGAELFIGEGVVFASHAANVIDCNDGAILYMDGEAYGGDGTLRHDGTGFVFVTDNAVLGGAQGDIIDYKGFVKFAERNCYVAWGGNGASDNCSTAHDDAKGVRTGGTYRGCSRIIHDVHRSKSLNFNLTISDARFNDRTGLLGGFSGIGSENVEVTHGENTYSNNLVNTAFDETDNPATNFKEVDVGDAWPF